MSSIFTRIIAREIPSEIVYEDDDIIAIKDINPAAPVHLLIIPKKEIATVNDLQPEDEAVMGRLFTVAARLAREHDIADSGYRLIMNTNDDGGQEVFHLHLHLLGGRRLGPIVPRQ